MYTPIYKKQFEKDLKRVNKRRKDLQKLKKVVRHLVNANPLPKKHADHALKGEYTNCRECHIEPDWLLIYFIQNDHITFVRTGSHSDLFK